MIERSPRRRGWRVVLLTWLVSTGCSPTARLEPVEGVIVFEDGEPLRGGIVTLSPSSGDGPPAHGQIDRGGRFRLTSQGRDGAIPGRYRVAIVQVGEAAAPGGRHDHRLIDPRFSSFETSGLEQQVEPGMAEVRILVQPSRASHGRGH
jgi:hypothetical protein